MPRKFFAIATLLLAAAPAAAAELAEGKLSINGLGEWSYLYSSPNPYLRGTPGGSWENAGFALTLSARPYERLTVAAQLSFTDEEGALADWAFASWRFDDRLTVKAGKVKQPFGISGDVRRVGVLRPFYSLPQSVYAQGEMSGEWYEGAGASGTFGHPSGWGLDYDLYFGEVRHDTPDPLDEVFDPSAIAPGKRILIDSRVMAPFGGFRAIARTPLEGLSFRASGSFGHAKQTALGATGGGEGEDRKEFFQEIYGLSAEYLDERWSARAEYFHRRDHGDHFVNAGYLEVARHFGPNWQVAGLVDLSRTVPLMRRSTHALLRHEELAAGLNYWFNPDLALKASYHWVHGNRFAFSRDTLDDQLLAGTLDPHTNYLQIGTQFAF